MKLPKPRPVYAKLKIPEVSSETFKIKILRFRGNGATMLSLVRGAKRLSYGELPDLKFFLHRNTMGGFTVTESRTGLAVHKSSNPSSELCLYEATAKLESGINKHYGIRGLGKHVSSLPSKEKSAAQPWLE